MRTILFRGKTLKDHGMLPAGSWITGGYYMDDCYGGCPQGRHYILTWNSGGPGGFMDRCEVERESVGQYIGLKDSKGKMVYEGDIVTATGNIVSIGVVAYSSQLASYHVKTGKSGFLLWPERGIELDVISNIHDNPELLGGTSDVG